MTRESLVSADQGASEWLEPGWSRQVKDILFLPLRFMLSESPLVRRLGLSTLSDARLRAAIPYCHGRTLDATCGSNRLKRILGPDVLGADILWQRDIDVCADAHVLPFANGSFDTVLLLASLNYMKSPAQVLAHVYRILAPDGRVIITMIAPWVGKARIVLQNPFLHVRAGWRGGERRLGMRARRVRLLLANAGFRQVEHHRFLYGLNHLFVGSK